MTRMFVGRNHRRPIHFDGPRGNKAPPSRNAWNNRFEVLNNEDYESSNNNTSQRHHARRRKDRPDGASTARPHPQRIPPEFFALTRDHFVIVKSIHHLSTLRQGLPPSLLKKKDILSGSVKPAFKNDFFTATVDSITSSWCSSVHQALREHYKHLIDAAMDHISSKGMPARILDDSLRLVHKWARTQLGRKLLDEELDEALSLIREHQLQISEPRTRNEGPRQFFVDVNPEPADLAPATLHQGTQTPRSSSLPLQDPAPSEAFSDLPPPPSPLASSAGTSSVATSTDSGLATSRSGLAPATQCTGSLRQTQLQNFSSFSLPSVSEACFTNSSCNDLDPSKSNIILGDSNLCNFDSDDCSIVASSKGRLSFYKSMLQSMKSVHENVSNFIICLSYLDNRNKTATNFTAFRALIYNARRVFPNARVSVLLNCLADTTSTDSNSLSELNELICQKKPANCEIISPPEEVSVQNGIWGRSTRDNIFQILQSFL